MYTNLTYIRSSKNVNLKTSPIRKCLIEDTAKRHKPLFKKILKPATDVVKPTYSEWIKSHGISNGRKAMSRERDLAS